MEFIRYCQGEFTPQEHDKFHDHIAICFFCREKFIISWKLITEKRDSEEDRKQDRSLLDNPEYKAKIDALAKKCADDVRRLQAEGKLTPWPTPIKKSSKPPVLTSVLRAAIIIIAVAIPLTVGYVYFNKSVKDRRVDLRSNEQNGIIKEFDRINKILSLSADNETYLLKRSAVLEEALLFEEAAKINQQLSSMAKEKAIREEAHLSLQRINRKLVASQPIQTSYALFNKYIDDYLIAREENREIDAEALLTQADIIADKMVKNGDRYGIDSLNYYRNVSSDAARSLKIGRQLIATINGTNAYDNIETSLKQAQDAAEIFFTLNARCDWENAAVQILRFKVRMNKFQEVEKLAGELLQAFNTSRHLYLKGWCLLWLGLVRSGAAKFNQAIEVLEECAIIADKIEDTELTLKASGALTGFYFLLNENNRAIAQGFEHLKIARAGHTLSIQAIQLMGMSAFNLKFEAIAEEYLRYSILVAEQQQAKSFLGFSHTLLGLMRSEQGRFTESDEEFLKAFSIAAQINEEASRNYLNFSLNGYYARAQSLAGNTDKAIDLYNRTIALAEKMNIQQKLVLSQLHQGLGESLIVKGARGQAEAELVKAVELEIEGRARSEQNNPLLSFAVSRKSCKEQLRSLRGETN
jgi:hypothetical protein